MKLLCISDIHGDLQALKRILAADSAEVILLGGDITDFGTPDEAEQFVRTAQQDGTTVLAVAGNCDSATIDARLTQMGVALFGRGVTHGNVGFYGLSAMPRFHGSMYELSEADMATALQAGREQIGDVDAEVVLSHPPPHDCQLDRTGYGDHAGSTSLRQLVESAQPSLVVCGHVHEARGVDAIGPTTIVNCGPAFRGYYAVAEVGKDVTVELRTAPA